MMVSGDGRVGIGLAVGIHHRAPLHHAASFHGSERTAWFASVVFEAETPPAVIVDHEIPVPDERWELRTSGLWADHICEIPFRHWSYGLEAFALAIDDGSEMLGRGYGNRIPLGWELEFEGDSGSVQPLPAGQGQGYGQSGEVHGLLLLAGRSEPVEGPAFRQHWWGSSEAAPTDDLDHQVNRALADRGMAGPEPEAVALPVPGGVWWVTRLGRGLGSRTETWPAGQR